MTSQKNHQKSGLFIPITVFILLFLLFGAIGFVSASFDGNGGGTDKPISDPACWFWFLGVFKQRDKKSHRLSAIVPN